MRDALRKIRENGDRQGILYAVYFAVMLVFLFNPLEAARNEVTAFNRTIGLGLMTNVDVSRRIGNFNRWFLCFAAAVVFFYVLAVCVRSRVKDRGEETRKVLSFLDHLIVLADINLLFYAIRYFEDQSLEDTVFHYSTWILAAVIGMMIAYVLLGLEKRITADGYAMLCVSAFALGWPMAILSRQGWRSGGLLLGMQVLLMLLALLAVCFVPGLFQRKFGKAAMLGGVLGLSMLPFVTSFYTELVNILNQYGIFITLLGRYYAAAVLLLFAVTFAVILLIAGGKLHVRNWKGWCYPWLVFGIGCLYAQVPLEQTYHADIFESANYSILISDFLNFGFIPIVEHYGGHMMTGVWEGILYAVLNQDYAGAVFGPYSGYLASLLAVLFFYLVKKVWNEDMALLAALFFPFYDCFSYYGLGMLVGLAAMAYVRKNTWPGAVLLWGAFVWCALYRLDLGYSFGLACIAALLVYVIACKNRKAAVQLAVSLAGWGACGCAVWAVLCLLKGINPVSRLLEFLMISASNQNWAYAGIGYPEDTLFAWGYIILPFAVCGCLLYAVFSKGFREKAGKEVWILLLLFGFAYFTNFSRGLVRHSLAETDTAVVTWTAYIFLAVFLSCYAEKKRLFLPVLAVLILCGNGLVTVEHFGAETIGETAVKKTGEFVESWRFGGFSDTESQTYWTDIRDNRGRVNRVQWEDELEETVRPYTIVLDALLEEDGTYVDFINKTFVYSAVGRRNPAYVSQSPMQLSGEFSQERFVEEIEGVPLVLMPVNNDNYARSLDHIENAYRYYKVSEYIYENYVPLCKYEDAFAVWCLREQFEEMRRKLAGMEDEKLSLIDYGYDGPGRSIDDSGNVTVSFDNEFHSYDLAWLPVIWAEADGEEAASNPAVCELECVGGDYVFDSRTVPFDKNGNYLLLSATFDGQEDETAGAELVLGNLENGVFSEKYRYFLVAKAGAHEYLFRVSSDYYWHLREVNAVRISCDAALYDVKMKILEGD